eukprot:GEMP01036703.1.p1 GENE.GEMP01036703.1~~GEMP01036703.1.p1  ORF type:complete len:315 (+),score=44.00 GEMP01036703.1:105-1049(+)
MGAQAEAKVVGSSKVAGDANDSGEEISQQYRLFRADVFFKAHAVSRISPFTHYMNSQQMPVGSLKFTTSEEIKQLYEVVVELYRHMPRPVHLTERMSAHFRFFFTVAVRGTANKDDLEVKDFIDPTRPFCRTVYQAIYDIFPDKPHKVLVCCSSGFDDTKAFEVRLRFNWLHIFVNEERAEIIRRKMVHALRHNEKCQKLQEKLVSFHIDNTWEMILRTYRPYLRLPYCDRSNGPSRPYIPGGIVEINDGIGTWNPNARKLSAYQLLKLSQVAIHEEALLTDFPVIDDNTLCRAHAKRPTQKPRRLRTTQGSYA